MVVKDEFEVDFHPQDVDGVLNGQGVVSKPQLPLEYSGVLIWACYNSCLGTLGSKRDLPPSSPGHDIPKLAVSAISGVSSLFIGATVVQLAVIYLIRD